MRKRDILSPLSLLLLILGAITGITGLIEAALDLNRFVYHKYSAYLFAALLGIHLFLHRKSLILYIKRYVLLLDAAPAAVAGPLKGVAVSPDSLDSTAVVEKSAAPQLLSRRHFLLYSLFAAGGFAVGRTSLAGQAGMAAEGGDLGEVYHQWSKPSYIGLLTRALNWGAQPPLYKTYPSARKVHLPQDLSFRGLTVEEAINKRRSMRDYSGEAMSLLELSALLHYAYGFTGQRTVALRAAPSAGALYPLELYPVVHNVSQLPKGVYHYSVQDHSLELVKEGDYRARMTQYAVGQEMVGQANVALVVTAIFQRTRWKYRERAYRYVLLDAGHLGQNIYLAATSMGLGPCAVGAFFDDDINRLLGVDGVREAAIYLLVVGKV
ncbi:MAG: SagB/ThcOx family dehydrogenase [Anaerolineae bacterium]